MGGSAADGLAKLALAREIEEFLIRELALLDDRRFEDWAALFTDDGYYWAPAKPDQDNPEDHVSLFFDDKEIMNTRVSRLRHPRVHAQIPPSRTSHMISNLEVDPSDPAAAAYDVRTRFLMLEYRPGGDQRSFGGRYEYRLIRRRGDFGIAAKKATILNCDAVMMPLSLPF